MSSIQVSVHVQASYGQASCAHTSHSAHGNGPQAHHGIGQAKQQLAMLLVAAVLARILQAGNAKGNATRSASNSTPTSQGSGKPATSPQSNATDEAVSMMVTAMRQGRADSLLAGQDDASFERDLSAMSTDLRDRLNA